MERSNSDYFRQGAYMAAGTIAVYGVLSLMFFVLKEKDKEKDKKQDKKHAHHPCACVV